MIEQAQNINKYEVILNEKKRQSQDFRRFLTWKSSGSFVRSRVGCDVGFLRSWIESMFLDGMNWNNYGSVWVVDHIVPFRHFDIFKEDDLLICWNYRNLMPIFDKDNLKKQGNVFFAFELLNDKKHLDNIYLKLFNSIKPEVEWMCKYIDNYNKPKNL